MTRALIVWGNWGPYHYARFHGFRTAGERAGIDVHGLQLFPTSGHYAWQTPQATTGVHYLNIGNNEARFHPWRMCRHVVPFLRRLRPDVVFVPSYWHWSLFINFVARLRGARIVMMNETHGGTAAPPRGLRHWIRCRIVSRFHAALVGGSPHRRFFSAMGLAAERIFPGYDAVDNDLFSRAAAAARANADEHRTRLGLPARYFLSLGRFVEKKNLGLLVRAFAALRTGAADQPPHHLVFVGSGETQPAIRALCTELGLATADHEPGKDAAAVCSASRPTVHFYGFRQVDENPVFYALATAFILPSVREEWGLVVNEAMACGIPALVSRPAGCAEDLVADGTNGFLFDPNDDKELARALQTLADDPARARRMGEAAAEHIRTWGCDRFGTGAVAATQAALSA